VAIILSLVVFVLVTKCLVKKTVTNAVRNIPSNKVLPIDSIFAPAPFPAETEAVPQPQVAMVINSASEYAPPSPNGFVPESFSNVIHRSPGSPFMSSSPPPFTIATTSSRYRSPPRFSSASVVVPMDALDNVLWAQRPEYAPPLFVSSLRDLPRQPPPRATTSRIIMMPAPDSLPPVSLPKRALSPSVRSNVLRSLASAENDTGADTRKRDFVSGRA
jgi:hypothetical protein